MAKTRIVVGVDGSPTAAKAVRWAAEEARRRQADLRVLMAFHQPGPADERAAVLHDAVIQARALAPGVEVRCVALPGYAVPVLLRAAEEAMMLVVGTRGSSGLPGRPAGSVSSQVATHSRAPVVVVRGRTTADAGPVVAGIDDDAEGEVLGRAFEAAALHDAPLLVVTARPGAPASAAPDIDVDLRLDPWREKYPKVHAERRIVDGRPDKVLVELSGEARLVVVGPRGHGFEGVLLGATGERLLQRSGCPVLIARS